MASPTQQTKRLLIIGNGATAIDDRGDAYINQHTCNLLIDLAAKGWRVTFAQPGETATRNATLYDAGIPRDHVRVIAIFRKPLSLVHATFQLVAAISRSDLVYLFFPGSLARMVARLCRAIGRPYAIYLRGEQFDAAGSDAAFFAAARFLVSVSSPIAERAGPRPQSRAVIQPMFDLTHADAEAPHRERSATDPVHCLFVGRLSADKGIPELVRAGNVLQDAGVDLRLTLVGGGTLHEALVRQKAAEGLDWLDLPGLIAERDVLMDAYRSADLFVLPTHHEGFPRVLYEAMMKSVPIVTTMVGGIPGLMKDEENCIAIPVGDPLAIAAAIRRMADDPQLRYRLGKSGRKTVLRMLAERPTHLEAFERLAHDV